VFLVLVAQQAKHLNRIIFSSMASPVVKIFFLNYITNDRIFGENVSLKIKFEF